MLLDGTAWACAVRSFNRLGESLLLRSESNRIVIAGARAVLRGTKNFRGWGWGKWLFFFFSSFFLSVAGGEKIDLRIHGRSLVHARLNVGEGVGGWEIVVGEWSKSGQRR